MRRFIAISFSAIALLGLTACSSAPNSVGEVDTSEFSDEMILLDVRTPEEYEAGYLDGAQLLDFNSGDLAAAIPGLDPDAEYLVYCRSGNRSSQAITLMEQYGFTNLTNLGSLEQAAEATKLPIMS